MPANGKSFLQTDGSGISLITWKAAEDGDGTILRLAETTGKPVSATLRLLHRKVISAILCSGVEESRAPPTVQNQGGHPSFDLSFKPFQVLTVKLISE